MAEQRTLLRGGHVMTMDEALGDLPGGDVLIEGSQIAAVGVGLEAEADEVIDASGRIVLPGLIDTHIHLWQTPLRGLAADGWGGEYFQIVHPLSGLYRAPDMGAATYGGAIELLRNGVTTVFDFCHSVNAPEFADASVDALRRAGIRALYGYSFRDRPEVAERAFHSHDERLADARRVRSELCGDDEALVRMAIALNNIGHVEPDQRAAEIALARELGVTSTIHSLLHGDITVMRDQGLLGPDLQWVHSTAASDAELAMVAEHGGTIAATPAVELGMEGLFPVTGRCVRRGIPTSLGVDVVSAVAGDLIEQMRLAFFGERLLDSQEGRMFGHSPQRTADRPTLTARQVLGLGTIDGARAIGLGERTGSLTPGKQADVLVLSTEPFGLSLGDPAAHVVGQASTRDVEHVLVGGAPRVRDGQLVGVDVAAMRRSLDDAREHIRAHAHDAALARWDRAAAPVAG